MKKLISMTEFVNDIFAEAKAEPFNALDKIHGYQKLLWLDLNLEMFKGKNALFPDFKIVTSHVEACEHRGKSVFRFSPTELAVTIYERSERQQNKMCFHTKFHLKKVEDLVDMDVYFNEGSNLYKNKN